TLCVSPIGLVLKSFCKASMAGLDQLFTSLKCGSVPVPSAIPPGYSLSPRSRPRCRRQWLHSYHSRRPRRSSCPKLQQSDEDPARPSTSRMEPCRVLSQATHCPGSERLLPPSRPEVCCWPYTAFV